ncbi:MAG: hypothetical protein LBG92_01320 [Prevotellaceae bacterium]|nr:hypothetical protein [Prevotellaceae bacterium]
MSKITALFVLILSVSCGNIRDIKVENVQLKTLKGNKAVIEVNVFADNSSPHNIYVKDASFEILRDGYSFGTAKLKQQIRIDKNSQGSVPVLFDLEITDRMLILSGRIRAILSGNDRTKLSLSGKIKAGTKIFSKTVNVENYEF